MIMNYPVSTQCQTCKKAESCEASKSSMVLKCKDYEKEESFLKIFKTSPSLKG